MRGAVWRPRRAGAGSCRSARALEPAEFDVRTWSSPLRRVAVPACGCGRHLRRPGWSRPRVPWIGVGNRLADSLAELERDTLGVGVTASALAVIVMGAHVLRRRSDRVPVHPSRRRRHVECGRSARGQVRGPPAGARRSPPARMCGPRRRRAPVGCEHLRLLAASEGCTLVAGGEVARSSSVRLAKQSAARAFRRYRCSGAGLRAPAGGRSERRRVRELGCFGPR